MNKISRARKKSGFGDLLDEKQLRVGFVDSEFGRINGGTGRWEKRAGISK
jgi:hypothetical protein